MQSQPKVSVEERARRYVAAMPAAISGAGGHNAFFNVVRALIHGFGFTPAEARPFVDDYNRTCEPAWSESEINHKLRSVDALSSKWPRGYLRNENDWRPSPQQRRDFGIPTEEEVRKKVGFELDKLKRIAAPWRDQADAVWLANRSAVDPASIGPADFLRMMYPDARERILVFTNEYSQGDAVWPVDEMPAGGRVGVWFLPQPVTGEMIPNPEKPKGPNGEAAVSRRTWRSVTTFRYFVIESDEAPLRDWLGFIVQAPLRIEALYTSGGRSVHALIRVDCPTKEAWDAEKRAMMPFLMGGLMCGADRGTWSAVRLSRLPGCLRRGKMGARNVGGRDIEEWQKFPEPRLQKLLYIRPAAELRPICERPAERDVEGEWCAKGKAAVDGYVDNDENLRRGLAHYAPVSAACRAILSDLEMMR
jgi:hypothetical protein